MTDAWFILALDPGKETGWALLDKDGTIMCVGSVKPYRELWECLPVHDYELIVMEELLAFSSRMSGERYKVEGVIELWAELNNVKLEPMHPSTVKKLITGQGNAKKADMRRALKERVEIPGKSNVHIVDAVAVGLAYLVQHENLML